MKRLTALLLSVLIVLCCVVSVNAEEVDLENTGYANMGTGFYATIQLSKYAGNYLTLNTADSMVHLAPAAADVKLQKWYFVRLSDGSYTIKNCFNNGYLTVNKNSLSQGSKLCTASYNGYITQKWCLNSTANGYQLLSKANTSYDIECNSVVNIDEITMDLNSNFSGSYFTIFKISSVTSLGTPNFTLSSVKEGVQIKWTAVEGAMTYRIYRYNDSKKSWTTMKETTDTRFVDTNVGGGYTYKYTVKCISPLTSGWKAKSIRFIAAPVVSVENTASGPKIKWSKPGGAVNFRVFVKNGSSWKKLGDTTSTSFIHTGFKYNTVYIYTVRCINAAGTAYTSGYDPDGVQNRILVTPQVSLSLNTNHIRISWNNVTGAAGYRIYYKTKDSSWKEITTTTETSYQRYDVTDNVGYYFTVRAIDYNGKNLSGFKASRYLVYYHAPLIEEIRYTSTYRTLYWNSVNGAAQYRVFSWNGTKWVNRGTTKSTSFKVDLIGEDYQNVCYAVRCLNADNQYISSYYENVLDGSYIYAYEPKEYTDTHRV